MPTLTLIGRLRGEFAGEADLAFGLGAVIAAALLVGECATRKKNRPEAWYYFLLLLPALVAIYRMVIPKP